MLYPLANAVVVRGWGNAARQAGRLEVAERLLQDELEFSARLLERHPRKPAALETRAIVVPVAVIGAEEAHPILFRSTLLERLVGVPVPLTPKISTDTSESAIRAISS